MTSYRWQEILEEVKRFDKQKNTREAGNNGQLNETTLRVERRMLWRSVRWASVVLGLGCALLVSQLDIGRTNTLMRFNLTTPPGYVEPTSKFDFSWITRSPLFEVLGASLSLVLLSSVLLAGCLFWLFTANNAVIAWSINMLPFGVEPYRSALGILGSFVLLAFLWNRLPVLGRLNNASLQYVRIALWSVAGTALVSAVVVAITM